MRRRRWVAPVAALTVVAAAVGLNVVGDAMQRARKQAVLERLDVRVTDGGSGSEGPTGLLVLTFTVQNRGGPVRFGVPTLDPPVYPVQSSTAPGPLAPGVERGFDVRLQLTCDDLSAPRGPLRVRLPVTGPRGQTEVVDSPLDSAFVAESARYRCGLIDPADALLLRVVGPVRTTPAGVVFWLAARNTSLRDMDLVALSAPGLRLRTREGLPVVVAPGATATRRVTMSVRECALVATATSAQQTDGLGPAELAVEVHDARRASASIPIELLPGQPSHTQWLSYIARSCPT